MWHSHAACPCACSVAELQVPPGHAPESLAAQALAHRPRQKREPVPCSELAPDLPAGCGAGAAGAPAARPSRRQAGPGSAPAARLPGACAQSGTHRAPARTLAAPGPAARRPALGRVQAVQARRERGAQPRGEACRRARLAARLPACAWPSSGLPVHTGQGAPCLCAAPLCLLRLRSRAFARDSCCPCPCWRRPCRRSCRAAPLPLLLPASCCREGSKSVATLVLVKETHPGTSASTNNSSLFCRKWRTSRLQHTRRANALLCRCCSWHAARTAAFRTGCSSPRLGVQKTCSSTCRSLTVGHESA